MTKCDHGVMIPQWYTQPNVSPYCSGCTVLSDIQGEDISKLAEKWEAILVKENTAT